jgi:putative glutamine amidotransferase
VRVLLVHSDNRPFEVERFGNAWTGADGEPAELVPLTPATATEVLARTQAIAGVLLSGGPDLEPWRYGAEPEAGIELRTNPARDTLDLGLLKRAEQESWPVLAICYGAQALNVFHCGTLIQDLARAGLTGHSVAEPKDFLAHPVQRSPARFLAPLPLQFDVNSRHHQAIAQVGEGLRVVATAPDGVIEAVEADGPRWVVGIQWHPENIPGGPHAQVFRLFRAACCARATLIC